MPVMPNDEPSEAPDPTIRLRPTRRAFLGLLAGAGVVPLGLAGCGDDNKPIIGPAAGSATTPDAPAKDDPRLTPQDRELIRAVAQIMIPKDDVPGAEAVDVIGYFLHRVDENPSHLEMFQYATKHLELTVKDLYPGKHSFAELSTDQREYMLRAFFGKEPEAADIQKQYDSKDLLYQFFLLLFDSTRSAYWNSDIGYQLVHYTSPLGGYADFHLPPKD